MFYLLALLIALLVISYIVSRDNVLSPAVMTSLIWICALILFLILGQKLPPLSTKFLVGLLIWTTCFIGTSLFFQSFKYENDKVEPSLLVKDIYLAISIVTFPLLIIWTVNALKTGPDSNWALNLRLAALGKTPTNTDVYSPIYILIWQLSYMLELLTYDRKKWKRTVIPAVLYLAYGISTMSKAVFLNFFVITVGILYFKKAISTKHIIVGISVLLMLLFGIESIRTSINLHNENQRKDFVVLYVIGSMSAFQTVEPHSAEHPGENVFRLYYAVNHKLNPQSMAPIKPILPWIKKPIETNTYTTLYPFYKDFGFWGIAIFALLLGSLYGWIFKKAIDGNGLYIILYAYILNIIVMQYVAELTFTNLAGHIKFLMLLIIPFAASRFQNQRQVQVLKP